MLKGIGVSNGIVVGKVIKILPGLGIIRKTFFNPLVLITLIITLYTISYVLRSSSKKDNDQSKKKFDYRNKIDKLINSVITKLLKTIEPFFKI